MADFFEFSNEMLCTADERGYFTRANQAWAKTLGWSIAELTSRPYFDFVHPDDLAATIREASRLLHERHETVHFENRYLHRDGSYRWLAWRAIREPESNQIMATARDVTDEKLQAEALRESDERFRSLAMHAPVGISRSELDGRAIFVNSKLCEIAGAEPADVLGFGWLNFMHPEEREMLLERQRSDIESGHPYSTADFRFLRKDGSVRWASSTSALLHDARGKPIGQIAILEDITDRKATEDALRTKQSQLTGILDNTPAVVFLKDLQGYNVLVNRQLKELFGDTTGKKDSDVFPAEIAGPFLEADRQVMEQQRPLVFEEIAMHADGPHTYRSVKFPVKDETGRMIAMGGIATDITDLKQAHDSLQKKEKLLRKMIDVQENEKQLLCHEFHDGLIQYAVGSLMSLEGLQCTQSMAGLPAAQQVIGQVINNLRKGIDDGRRVIRGIRPAVLDDSNLEAAIHDLIDQLPASDIMVKLRCEGEIGRLSDTMQTTVYRVVQEALNNARKHSGTDVIRIELRKDDGSLHLDIRDFGCGFDVKSSGNRGFGLLGMTERVRLLGGECSITSQPDAGTQIAVRLPLDEPGPGDRTEGD